MMNYCPQGMMVYLIGYPDQVKNKILASFVSLWFVSFFEPPASLKIYPVE